MFLDAADTREQLEGKLTDRYGFAKEKARKDINDWLNSLRSANR